MKLKKSQKKRLRLIKLELIKTKIYLQQNFLSKDSLLDILNFHELELKRILKIIYNYHTNNRLIYFIGVPLEIQINLSKTNHLFLPESSWIKGMLSNRISIFRYIKKSISDKKLADMLFKVKTKPSLLVVFNQHLESDILEEARKMRIPVLILTNPINQHSKMFSKKLNNIIFTLLHSVLKS